MRLFKKLFPLILVLILALSLTLVSCKEDENSDNPDGAAVEGAWKVTFDYNYEGAPEAYVVDVKNNERVTKPNDPTRNGFEFLGWFLDNTAMVQEVFLAKSNVSNDPISKITANTVFYAGWKDPNAIEPDPLGGEEPDPKEEPKERALSSISAESRTERFVGAILTKADFAVTASYDDESTAIVTGFVIGSYDSTTEGTKNIEISYTENEVTVTCEVEMKINQRVRLLSYVSAAFKGATKHIGDTITAADFSVTAHYDDDSSEAVTANVSVGEYSTEKFGKQEITVDYTEGSVTESAAVEVMVYFAEDGYYLMGIDGDWGAPSHKLIDNEATPGEVMLTGVTVDGEGDAVKIVGQKSGVVEYYNTLKEGVSAALKSYDAMGNIVLGAGTYDFYFDTASNLLWLAKTN